MCIKFGPRFSVTEHIWYFLSAATRWRCLHDVRACKYYVIKLIILTPVGVFLPPSIASAGQSEPPWPPSSSACHLSPPQRWSRGPLHRVPSMLPSTPLILPHPAGWPGSSLPAAHFWHSLVWVLIPQHRGLEGQDAGGLFAVFLH